MKITKAKLKQIIKEELQVILTNEEVEEMFGEEVRAKVEEIESKQITKEAIMEEIQSDSEMLEAIEKLTDSIESLDVSIDFLSAAFTGALAVLGLIIAAMIKAEIKTANFVDAVAQLRANFDELSAQEKLDLI